jgi:hypothetical protein
MMITSLLCFHLETLRGVPTKHACLFVETNLREHFLPCTTVSCLTPLPQGTSTAATSLGFNVGCRGLERPA